ncbi:hypothetical protein GQ457_13G023370 [Hibiscus cannabinus]
MKSICFSKISHGIRAIDDLNAGSLPLQPTIGEAIVNVIAELHVGTSCEAVLIFQLMHQPSQAYHKLKGSKYSQTMNGRGKLKDISGEMHKSATKTSISEKVINGASLLTQRGIASKIQAGASLCLHTSLRGSVGIYDIP